MHGKGMKNTSDAIIRRILILVYDDNIDPGILIFDLTVCIMWLIGIVAGHVFIWQH